MALFGYAWNDGIFLATGLSLLPLLVAAVHLVLLAARKQVCVGLGLLQWACPKASESGTAVQLLVQEKVEREKVESFRTLTQVLCAAVTGLNVSRMTVIASGGKRYNTAAQDVLQVTLQVLLTLMSLRPGLVTTRSLNACYAALMVHLTLFVTPFTCDAKGVMPAVFLTTAAAVLMTGVKRAGSPCAWFTLALCNTFFALSSAGSLYVHAKNCSPAWSMSGIELLIIGVATWAACLAENSIAAMMIHSFRVQETTELYAAACALLRSFCEVVVELDPEGVILGPGHELSSFLLHGPNQRLAGTPLAELIADSGEREAFLQRLRAPTREDVGVAENMPVSMRDSDNNMLRLELLWFRFKRLDGQPHYMIGIREFSDFIQNRRPHGEDATVLYTASKGLVRLRTPEAACYEEVIFGPEEASPVPETRTNSLTSEGSVGRLAVVIDCTRPGFPIRGLTSGFCSRIGHVSLHTPITDLMANRAAFTTWLELSIKAMRLDLAPLADQWVKLHLPHGDFEAVCSLMPEREEEVEDAQGFFDVEQVQLFFHSVQQSRGTLSVDRAIKPHQHQQRVKPNCDVVMWSM